MRLYNNRTHEYAKVINEGDTWYKIQYERDGLIAVAPKVYFEKIEELEEAQ